MLALAGCQGGARETTVARGSTEQLLISTAANRALARYDASAWAGKQVFLGEAYLASLDRGFVLSNLRQRLIQSGAKLVEERARAEVILELRAASLGMTDAAYKVGVPALPVPLFGIADGTFMSPEFTVGFEPQRGWAKLVVWAVDAQGEHLDRQVVWGHSMNSNFYEDVYPGLLQELEGKGASQ
ncbi:MAG: DUF6655 family protein [Planctomycetota bacterium]